jgi:hypothetical protein
MRYLFSKTENVRTYVHSEKTSVKVFKQLFELFLTDFRNSLAYFLSLEVLLASQKSRTS